MDKLAELRNKIDDVDEKIVGLLAERFRLIGEISKVKVKLKIPLVDVEREKEILVRVKKLTQNYKVNVNLVEEIFKKIISCCTRFEKTVREKEEKYQ